MGGELLGGEFLDRIVCIEFEAGGEVGQEAQREILQRWVGFDEFAHAQPAQNVDQQKDACAAAPDGKRSTLRRGGRDFCAWLLAGHSIQGSDVGDLAIGGLFRRRHGRRRWFGAR